jgi:hypothetical protein
LIAGLVLFAFGALIAGISAKALVGPDVVIEVDSRMTHVRPGWWQGGRQVQTRSFDSLVGIVRQPFLSFTEALEIPGVEDIRLKLADGSSLFLCTTDVGKKSSEVAGLLTKALDKPSVTSVKAATPSPAPEGPAESKTQPTPSGKPPWNPNQFIWMAFLFSFAASGILAGLNWRRLGRPGRTWPTILLSVAGLVALLATLVPLPVSVGLSVLIAVLFNIGVGALLTYLQRPAYQEWVAAYGKLTAEESGCLIPAVVALGTLAVVIAFVLPPLHGIGLMALAVYSVLIVRLVSWIRSPQSAFARLDRNRKIAVGLGTVVLLFASLCVVGGVVAFGFVYLGGEPENLVVEAEYPSTVQMGDSFDLILSMQNTGDSAMIIGDIYLDEPFGGSILDGAIVERTDPPMEKDYTRSGIKSFHHDQVIFQGKVVKRSSIYRQLRWGSLVAPWLCIQETELVVEMSPS